MDYSRNRNKFYSYLFMFIKFNLLKFLEELWEEINPVIFNDVIQWSFMIKYSISSEINKDWHE